MGRGEVEESVTADIAAVACIRWTAGLGAGPRTPTAAAAAAAATPLGPARTNCIPLASHILLFLILPDQL